MRSRGDYQLLFHVDFDISYANGMKCLNRGIRHAYWYAATLRPLH